MISPLFLIDGYKLSHRQQYPPGTTKVYSNWTPRSSRVQGQDKVVFFGLQYFLKKYLTDAMRDEFFDVPKDRVLAEYQRVVNGYLGPNGIGVDHIARLHDVGYLPLRIQALKEGTLCPLRVPMLTVENTLPDFFWLVNYIETLMSNVLWLPCTSATSAYRLRHLLNNAAKRTGGDASFVPWQGHDFSFRGMSGLEAAELSGMGHLLSFTGTDTIPAILAAEDYYPGNNGLIGGSVAATEHSVMSCGGKENECDTFNRLLDLYPSGVVSVVSDTWNLWDVITKTLPALKDKIMARDGKLVIRPDSGDPVKIICGDRDATTSEARKGVVQLLWELFGGKTNAAGFKELDQHIGVIYGDSITYDRAGSIVTGLAAKSFASTNIVFGVGSYTYQYTTRDTYGFAMKATWAQVDGEGRDLFKKPATDDGTKNSATGRLAVLRAFDGSLYVRERATVEEEVASELHLVWGNGRFIRTQSFAQVREVLWGVDRL